MNNLKNANRDFVIANEVKQSKFVSDDQRLLRHSDACVGMPRNCKVKDCVIPSLFTLILRVFVVAVFITFTLGCQGNPFSEPPIHFVPNMDNQPKYKAQSKGEYFENGSAMRMPVEGTIARGNLRESDEYYRGKDPITGEFVKESPVDITMTGLKRGQERFDIYCAVCHGQSGDGRGIMLEYKYVPPPTFHSDLVRDYPDGHIFDVISNGKGNMPAYAPQVKVEDRWLIINYLRTLQYSQHAKIDELPSEIRKKIIK